jgi:hypothetical protein
MLLLGGNKRKKEIRKKEYEVNKIRQVKNTGFSLKTYLCYLTDQSPVSVTLS